MLDELASKLESGSDLSISEMSSAMNLLLSDKVPDEQKAEFLKNLTAKGETDDELYAMLGKMDEYGLHIEPKQSF